jgi:hypothetical protein
MLFASVAASAVAPVLEADLGSAGTSYVVASTETASSCPDISPCECHCDCELTQVQKELPPAAPPPPPCAPPPPPAAAALIGKASSTSGASKGGISLAVEAVRRLRAAAATAGATRRATRLATRHVAGPPKGPPGAWEKEVLNMKGPNRKKKTWDDNNPNFGDTQWSQMHPECPMGKPCYCDCQCRGPPPQNFVNPPPPPCIEEKIDGSGFKKRKSVDVDWGSSGLKQ